MSFNFESLDNITRNFMLEEIDLDIKENKLYYSKRFSENGKKLYIELLKKEVLEGNESTLASCLRNNNCFKTYHEAFEALQEAHK